MFTVSVLQESGEILKVDIAAHIVDLAKSLNYAPEKYFIIDSWTIFVPLATLVQTRMRQEGVVNAATLMKQALEGIRAPREPLAVKNWKDGWYLVIDGNSTATIAKAAGWPDVPCRISPE